MVTNNQQEPAITNSQISPGQMATIVMPATCLVHQHTFHCGVMGDKDHLSITKLSQELSTSASAPILLSVIAICVNSQVFPFFE
jgi:hypothetical protein